MTKRLTFPTPLPHSKRPGRSVGLLSKPALLFVLLSLAVGFRNLRAQESATDAAAMDRTLGANAPAYRALMDGRVEEAATLLRTSIAANPADSVAHQLLCRVYYAQEQAEDAIHQCELAVGSKTATAAQASDNNLWLGRAYGMKARRVGPIGGFTLARRVQASFARAVELNPSNVAALNDLGEYDVAAPFIVGGGSDKAQALAAQMMPRFPASAHRLLARLADSNNDLGVAETEFKRAVAAQGSADAWIDLAHFYQDHGRNDDALAAVKSGLAADHTHGPVLVDAASILTNAHRAPDLAERCLRDYLASHAKSDAAPAFKVHLQLSRLLAARGDSTGASREVEAAAALAPAFAHSARMAQGQ